MSALDVLLDLQDHDVAIDQLQHRRAALPERAEMATLTRESQKLADSIAKARAAREQVAKEQKRLEDEVALLSAKAAAEDKKLYSGSVTAPKELQAIQDEIKMLDRRRRGLEDGVLEQMEGAEPLDATLASLAQERMALDARMHDVGGRLAEADGALGEQIEKLQREREQLTASADPAHLREYDGLRKRLGGVAVARLEGNSCRGCHLQLSALEVARIRQLPPDALAHCDECGRILVR